MPNDQSASNSSEDAPPIDTEEEEEEEVEREEVEREEVEGVEVEGEEVEEVIQPITLQLTFSQTRGTGLNRELFAAASCN